MKLTDLLLEALIAQQYSFSLNKMKSETFREIAHLTQLALIDLRELRRANIRISLEGTVS
jgi:hypothetical protein